MVQPMCSNKNIVVVWFICNTNKNIVLIVYCGVGFNHFYVYDGSSIYCNEMSL
jgi:hypothetical protein